METKRLPCGFEIPVLGIGTVNIGETAPVKAGENHKPDYEHDKEHIKAIKEAISLGYNHIDTAELYGQGHTEELIGKAITGLDRKKLFITTKVSKEHLRYDDLITSAKKSLKRLNTDYIDLYLIHRPNQDIPIKETMDAMTWLVDNRLIRHVGVSAFDVRQIREAQRHSRHPIVANQLKYSIWKRSDLRTIRYCQENNIIVIAYKLFGRGMITTDRKQLITDISKKHNKTEAQTILNWITSKKNTVAIFKSTNAEHLRENLEIHDFSLSDEEIQRIDSSVPLV
ncbi:aldo/keto reductase [Candidatus Woesearchaeota archaeon]|nr:aldo/keto reductase [Candidatus Woesearchaeota archaeon]